MSNTPIQYSHITKEGDLARIICTDAISRRYPVIAMVVHESRDGRYEEVVSLTEDLRLYHDDDEPFLEEYNPWMNVAVDTPIWVLMGVDRTLKLLPRHFAKYEGGFVYTYQEGLTSHTGTDQGCVPYHHAFLEKPTDA